MASLIVHGALTRFPALKIAVVENGGSWIEPLQRALKDTYKKMPQEFPEEPITAMRRSIHISPFWEEDYGHLADLLGDERVLFGSDYPHPEGLADPVAYADELAHHGEPLVRKFMGDNLARLMNVRQHAGRRRPRRGRPGRGGLSACRVPGRGTPSRRRCRTIRTRRRARSRSWPGRRVPCAG